MIQQDDPPVETAVSTCVPCVTETPAACISHVRLRDGADVLLRGATPDDADGLRAMFLRLGDDTRYYYFFSGVPATAHWADRFATLGVADGLTSYALVAQVEADLVGLARFDRSRDNPYAAEVGILLADGWQSRGLGRSMLLRLSEEARLRGITTFTGRILGENRRALALARRTFGDPRVTWAGEYEVTASLDPMPANPDETGGA